MKLNLSLKEPNVKFIEDTKNKLTNSTSQEVILKFIKSALKIEDLDVIFGPEKEKCSGGCFAAEPFVELEIDIDDFKKLKKIYSSYNFDDYDTEEEEISKVIRCIINFHEDESNWIL